ncbi:MAG: ribonuclease P protein component [Planctomycetes bacterium]|nr:ribonuclease P protein component [Planctomycetota bacterium]
MNDGDQARDQAGVRAGERLGPGERLKSKREFERTRREGKRAGDTVLRVLVARNGLAWPRLAAAIPRRYGPAVARNRLRRLYAEAFRREKTRLPPGVDVVLSPPPGAGPPDLPTLRAALVRLVTQAAARLPRSGPPPAAGPS